MKKRILSLLLLVAMIVTALPLAVLPAIAAESEKTYAAEDYNALYVQDGLYFGADFFRTNSYWNEPAAATLDDYIWTDGAFVNLQAATPGTVADGYLDMRTFGSHIYIRNSHTATNNTTTGTTLEQVGIFDATGGNVFAPNDIRFGGVTHTVVDGQNMFNIKIISMRNEDAFLRDANNANITVTAPHYSNINTVAMTAQMPTHTLNYYTNFNHKNFGVEKIEESYWNASFGTYSTYYETTGAWIFCGHEYDEASGGVKPVAAKRNLFAFYVPITKTTDQIWDAAANDGAGGYVTDPEGAKTYIVGLQRRVDKASVSGGDGYGEPFGEKDFYNPTAGSLGFYVNGTSYYNGEAYYANNNGILGASYFYKQNSKMHAVRQYTRILTADELAQNRFADLAKWFRIDLGYAKILNADSLAELYSFAATLAFEDETAGAALEQKAKTLAEAQYSSLDADVLATVATYGLDLSPLAAYPKGVLPLTYTFLLSGISASEDVSADYAAAVNADLLAYFAMGTMTQEDYNALYVQDGYLFGIDFFASNKIWSPNGVAADLGEEYVQPAGLTKDDLAVYTVTKTLAGVTSDVVTLETEAEANAKLAELIAAETEGATYAIVTAPASNHNTLRNAFFTAENKFLAKWFTKQPAGGGITMNLSTIPLRGTAPAYTNLDQYLKNQISAGVLADGYLQLRSGRPADNYLTMSGMPAAGKIATSPLVSDAMTQQIIGVHDAKATNSAALLMFGNVRINVRYDQVTNGMTFYSVGTNFTTTDTTRPSIFLSPKTTTLTFELRNFKSNAVANGPAALDIKEDTTLLHTLNGSYINAGASANSYGIGYGNSTAMKLYAARYYNVSLTNDELAQNHFADLAKFFRLNLSGFETLGDAEKKALYAAVSTFDLTSDRAAVQNAVSAVLTPYVREAYETMKGEDTKVNAFLDVAADYLLDVNAVLSSKRDMSSVFETVTAEALGGKSAAEAQVILDAAYRKAYTYLSYKSDNTGFNEYLVQLADAGLAIEALMALPKAEREAVVGTALSQDAINAFVAEKMAAYKTADYDYDSLYVQEGLFSQIDFFKLNSYWSDYKNPVLPASPASKIGEVPVFKADAPWIVVRWDNADKVTYYHLDNIETDSYTSGAAVPYTFASKEDAEKKAAALRESTGYAFWDVAQYPGVNGEYVNPAFNTLRTNYQKDVEEQLLDFVVKGDHGYKLSGQYITHRNWNDQTGKTQYAPFTYGDGYLQMNTGHVDNFLIFNPALPTTGTVTGEYILTAGAVRASGTLNFLHFSDATVSLGEVTANSVVFNGFYSYGGTFASNSSFATKPTVKIANTTPFSLGIMVDRTNYKQNADKTFSSDVSASLYVNGAQIGETKNTTDTIAATTATQIGYSSVAVKNRIYALRYYDRTLTAAEYAQNHFADLMKFFRIDMAAYDLLSDALRAELVANSAAFALDADRADVVAMYEAVLAKHYAAAKDEIDPYFLALAEKAQLDVAPLLAIREKTSRNAIAAVLTEEFPEGYATDANVLRSLYADALAFLDSIDFLGVQVRLETGNVNDEMPGVRSLFTIDKAVLKELLLAAKETGETVELGATVEMNGIPHTIYFYPVLGDDGEVTFREDGAKLQKFEIEGQEVYGFAYTVTYKNYKTYSAEQAYTLYNAEYDYSFFVKVGDNTFTRDVEYSDFEGGTVSAYKAYKHFFDQGKYLGNAMMEEVLQKGAVAPTETPAE